MTAELYANKVSTTVTAGGTDAPAGGTSQTFTVSSSTNWPAAATGVSQFRIIDQADTHSPPEIMLVTNVSGTTWTVTRGAEGPQVPYAHAADWTAVPVLTAAGLAAVGGAGSPVVRSFPFSHSTAGLDTGVTVYTPTVGELLLDAWFENDTGWVGTASPTGGNFTPVADIGTYDGSDYGLFSLALTSGIGVPLAADNVGLAGTGIQTPVTGSLASAWAQGYSYAPGAPGKFTATDPLVVVVSQDGSTSTPAAATLAATDISPPLVVTMGVNDEFGLENSATGGQVAYTVAPGTYTTVADVAAAMAAAVDGSSNPLSDYVDVTAVSSHLLATAVLVGAYGNTYYFANGNNDFLGPSGFPSGGDNQFRDGLGGAAGATAGSSVLYVVTATPLT